MSYAKIIYLSIALGMPACSVSRTEKEPKERSIVNKIQTKVCDNILDVTWQKTDEKQLEECCPPRNGHLSRLDDDPVCTNEKVIVRIHNPNAAPIDIPRDIATTYTIRPAGAQPGCRPVGSSYIGPDPGIIVPTGKYYDIDVFIERAGIFDVCPKVCFGSPKHSVVNVELELYQATIDQAVELHWKGKDLCAVPAPLI